MATRTLCRCGTIAVVALSLAGCALCRIVQKVGDISRSGKEGDKFLVPGYRVTPSSARTFGAGAASSDITPPTGYPTGGHGPAGEVARGYWMRLRARAFFFEDPLGKTLTLVSADLFAIPKGLSQRVAALTTERLAAQGIHVSLPPDAVVLAATHTHHGPGNFLTARVYNQFGSTWPGFDKMLFEFLADRISQAVADAVRSARSYAGPIELTLHSTRVGYDLLRNRAPETFLLNRDRDALLDAFNGGATYSDCERLPDEPPGGWMTPECPRLRALDRTLTVLEVTRSGKQIAGLVFFAAHPTDLPAETPFYSPDFIGEALGELERLGDGSPAVFGFFNGAEGDVTLRRQRRDLLEAVRFGHAFASQVRRTLSVQGRPLSLANGIEVRAATYRPSAQGTCGDAAIAPDAVMGTAALGGAEDDRTQLYDLGWKDGVRDSGSGAQGVKLPALDSRLLRGATFTSEMAPPTAFPQELPMVVARLGEMSLASIPVEASTAEGALIKRELRDSVGDVQLIGLANQYASYCATRDEYFAQDYMGASTLWGSGEGPYLACRMRELAYAKPIDWTDDVSAAEFRPGVAPKISFGFSFVSSTERPDDGLEKILRDPRGLPERRLPWFEWREVKSEEAFERASRRHVAVWEIDPGKQGALRRVDDDSGPGFITVHLGGERWAALWVRPLWDVTPSRYFFRIESERVSCSEIFRAAPGRSGPDKVKPGQCPPEE